MEKLLNEPYKCRRACCRSPFCPALLSICSVVICGKQYYYLSRIPHIHDSPIYQGEPSTLPLFFQKVLYYHSGFQFCESSMNEVDLSSPFSSLMKYITEEKRRLFTEDCKSCLEECARNTLGCEFDNGIKISETFDGM